MSINNLSDRERLVFFAIADGERLVDISKRLFLSIKTVSTYRTRILEKLNLDDNVGIVALARKIQAAEVAEVAERSKVKPIAEIQRNSYARDLAEIRKMVGALEEELIQHAIARLIAQRDNAWQELRDIREAVAADSDESTLDEVKRVVAQRDRWKADFEAQFSSSKEIAS